MTLFSARLAGYLLATTMLAPEVMAQDEEPVFHIEDKASMAHPQVAMMAEKLRVEIYRTEMPGLVYYALEKNSPTNLRCYVDFTDNAHDGDLNNDDPLLRALFVQIKDGMRTSAFYVQNCGPDCYNLLVDDTEAPFGENAKLSELAPAPKMMTVPLEQALTMIQVLSNSN